MTRLELAIEQIRFARDYTNRLLDQTRREDWFRQPSGLLTHIAWQVGHLTMGQFRIALVRIRGEKPLDSKLMPEEFHRLFGKDSTPHADAAKYPSVEAIRGTFDRVHQQLLEELPNLDERELDKPVMAPHPLVETKLWSLLWCAQHESLHAGQIGLTRRLLGYPSIW
jgi:hypothetical protein